VNNFTNYKKGFSLIELAVSISIILVITAVVIPNYLTAIEKYELDAVAIDTLLKFRESQVFSISSREGDDTFEFPYGIFFSTSVVGSDSFIFYRDRDKDGRYDPSEDCGVTAVECIEVITLKQGYTFNDICHSDDGSMYLCGQNLLSFQFQRPSPHAAFDPTISPNQVAARVVIRNPRGDTRTIEVFLSGLMRIQ